MNSPDKIGAISLKQQSRQPPSSTVAIRSGTRL
jgi:hypothetical protein